MLMGMEERTHPELVVASWPMVVLVLPPALAPTWIDELDAKLDEVFARSRRYAMIIDTRPLLQVPEAAERRAIVNWLCRPSFLLNQGKWNVGSSTIVPNAALRGALQALYWLWTPPAPQHAAGGLDEAWAWCTERLAQTNIDFPDPARSRALADEAVTRYEASRVPFASKL